MGSLRQAIPRLTAAVLLALLASAEGGEKVALRTAGGRFLRAEEDGTIRADRLIPGEAETFEWIPGEDGQVAIKAHNGRFLTAGPENVRVPPSGGRGREDRRGSPAEAGTPTTVKRIRGHPLSAAGPGARRLRADGPLGEPGDRETFALVHVGGNRVGMRARQSGKLLRFPSSGPRIAHDDPRDGPRPDQTVEVFCISEIPAFVCTGLGLAIQSLVVEELEGEEYDKVRTRKRKEYVELPAPTLRDPGRMKKHRVLSMTEEYHVKARLDGTPDVRIRRIPCLKGYFEPGVDLLMFEVRARVPISGRVRYKIPDTLSASTGYRTVVSLSAVGAVRAERSDEGLTLDPPELVALGVELHRLDLSNDVLHVVRRGIEDLANHELRSRRAEIRQKANKAIAKAIREVDLQDPLLSYLGLK
jgi:hypothetical protein